MKRSKYKHCNNECKTCKYGIMACGIWFCELEQTDKKDKNDTHIIRR